jgi:hypothetical protein
VSTATPSSRDRRDDPVSRSIRLQLLSAALRWSAASARAEANLLVQHGHHLRERIGDLIAPPPQ